MSTGLPRMTSTASGQPLTEIPLEAVGVQGPQPEQALGRDGGEEQDVANRPLIVAKRP